MPQMMPMNWFMMLMSSLILLIMLMSFIHSTQFIFYSIITPKKFFKINKNLIWLLKW